MIIKEFSRCILISIDSLYLSIDVDTQTIISAQERLFE